LMSEMEHTADQLIVIGRGELIAAESLTEFSARGTRQSAVVGTADATVLTDLLTAEGAAVHAEGELLTVTGLAAVRIGEIALEHRIPLHHLSTRSASLEEAFMELTADSVQYLAGDHR
jgi:ABC-2 type transport system ATP-binding protein